MVITRLDHLGRSLKSILNTIDNPPEKKASLKTLDGALDTSSHTALSQALVSLIGVFAQLELDLIADRSSEGRKAAMVPEVKMGRHQKISDQGRTTIRDRLANDPSTNVCRLAKEYGGSRTTTLKIKDGKR